MKPHAKRHCIEIVVSALVVFVFLPLQSQVYDGRAAGSSVVYIGFEGCG